MKQRHVSFTRTAQGHVAREKAWWLENRDHTEVFADELEQALKVVAILPELARRTNAQQSAESVASFSDGRRSTFITRSTTTR